MKRYILFFLVLILGLVSCKQSSNLKVGAIVPLTGPFAQYGIPVRDGMLLAVDNFNKMHNTNFELVIEDDQSKSKSAIDAMNKLVNIDKVPVVIGPLSSGNSMAVAPIAEKLKTVQISTLAGIPDLSNAGDYIFRIYPSSKEGAEYASLKAIQIFKPQKVAILYPSNPFGEVSKNIYSKNCISNKIDVVVIESYQDGDLDFKTQILKIKNAGADIILCSAYFEEGARILKQMIELNLFIPIIGEDGWRGNISEIAGNRATELLYFADIRFSEKYTENTVMQNFITNYYARYSKTANTHSAAGYDGVMVALESITKYGYSSDSIKKALYTEEYEGALGKIKFDSNGDNIGVKFAIFQIDSLNRAEIYSE